MAASNGDQQQQRPEKIAPLKWPIKREEYELLEVIGKQVGHVNLTIATRFSSRVIKKVGGAKMGDG